MIGQTILHYNILGKLGEGGMGVVYKAHDTKLDRDVALKFLPPELTKNLEAKERFLAEARAASALNHPNICSIHAIEEFEGHQFLVMEFIEGKTLNDYIKEKELTLTEILPIAIQIAEGLNAAHRKDIVHRDIKPDNIMLTDDGLVKIMDFGLAKLRGASKLTKTHSTLGTISYMSPEQACGGNVDRRSDIFSFGAVLYEMITGRKPFKGEHEAAILYSLTNETPEPLARYKTNVPIELQHIVDKALAKGKELRFQHIDEMIADLRRIQGVASGGFQIQKKKLKKLWTVVAIFVALITIGIYYFYPKSGPTATDRKSIAVLPFKNMSESKDDEYFSDGLTEDLIAQLAKISDMRVISRTSVMQYKNVNRSIREIADELNVVNILEGSVRSTGKDIRVVAQLIDAAKDEHLWAETYDREMTQIFAIQSDIAVRIASALKSKLSQSERDRIEKIPTDNISSYSYYVRGREYYNLYKNEYNEKAISFFRKSLELDPEYALAYAGLGDAFAQRVQRFGYPEALIDSSIDYSSRAIALDPTLAEGYKALGLGYTTKGWYSRGIEMYYKAIEYNPGATPAATNIGYVKLYTGKFDEAVDWLFKGLENDPMNVTAYQGLYYVYFFTGPESKYREIQRKLTALDPDNVNIFIGIIFSSIREKNYQRAIDESKVPLSIAPENVNLLSAMGDLQLYAGNLNEAKKYYESVVGTDSMLRSGITGKLPLLVLGYVEWEKRNYDAANLIFSEIIKNNERNMNNGDERHALRMDIALINAIKGNRDEACRWIEKAIKSGWRMYAFALMDPLLKNLRNDERFKNLMMEVKNDIDRMQKRIIAAENQHEKSNAADD